MLTTDINWGVCILLKEKREWGLYGSFLTAKIVENTIKKLINYIEKSSRNVLIWKYFFTLIHFIGDWYITNAFYIQISHSLIDSKDIRSYLWISSINAVFWMVWKALWRRINCNKNKSVNRLYMKREIYWVP